MFIISVAVRGRQTANSSQSKDYIAMRNRQCSVLITTPYSDTSWEHEVTGLVVAYYILVYTHELYRIAKVRTCTHVHRVSEKNIHSYYWL